MIKELLLRLIYGKDRSVNYITGPETLPPPLSKEEEEECFQAIIERDDPAARNKLVEHNLRLVVYIAKRFENTNVYVDDLISIGTIGLIKAIKTFDYDKNIKLATYASRCIENEILMHLRKISREKLEVSLDEPLNTDADGNELLLCDILGSDADDISQGAMDEVEYKLLINAVNSLNKREQQIIKLRYGIMTETGEEKTQKEVADMLGISQSYISRLEKKIIKKLKKEIMSKM